MAEIDFFGETYKINEVSQFALLEFSEALEDHTGEDDTAVGAAIMHMLREIVDVKDWKRFAASARRNKATGEEHLMPLIQKAVELMGETERPTERSSDSSDGPASIELRSVSASVRRVLDQEAGRPDRQMGILRSA